MTTDGPAEQPSKHDTAPRPQHGAHPTPPRLGDTGLTVGYIRVSYLRPPPEGEDANERMRRQERGRETRQAELAADAARDGRTIDAWYVDLNRSGRRAHVTNREAMTRLTEDARAGRVRRVYARDLSRLFRDLLLQEQWLAEMDACGVQVCAADLPGAPDDAASLFLRRQMGAIHEFLTSRAGELAVGTRRAKVLEGTGVGHGCDRWGLSFDSSTGAYRHDPATADRARLVFEVFVEAGGLAGLTAWHLGRLAAEGHPRATLSPQGLPWRARHVVHFVRLPAYRREVAYGGVRVEASHLIPAVVPPALIAEVDRLLAVGQFARARSKKATQAATSAEGWVPDWSRLESTYTALLRCGYCGGSVHVFRNSPLADDGPRQARGHSWVCGTAAHHGGRGPDKCWFGFSMAAPRLDALAGRAVREALRLYAGDNGFDGGDRLASFRPSYHRLAARQRRQVFIRRCIGDVEPNPPPKSVPCDAPPVLDREGWRAASGAANALWPPAGSRAATAGRTWGTPFLDPQKRDLLVRLGATVSARVLPRKGKKVSRSLRLLGGRACLSLDCPSLGMTGDRAYFLAETGAEMRAYRRWTRTKPTHYG